MKNTIIFTIANVVRKEKKTFISNINVYIFKITHRVYTYNDYVLCTGRVRKIISRGPAGLPRNIVYK